MHSLISKSDAEQSIRFNRNFVSRNMDLVIMHRQYENAKRVLSSKIREQNIKHAKEQRFTLLNSDRERKLQGLVKW